MFRKTLVVFGRDLLVSTRDYMSLIFMIVPMILAVAVNYFAPGIEDTTVNLAYIEGENQEMISYLQEYARMQVYKDYETLAERVMERDSLVGIVGEGSSAYILVQGNEPGEVVEYVQQLKTFFEFDRQVEDSTATIKVFGVKTPPIKMLWTNMGILLMIMLTGMLISLNIVDEKMDNTVSAINVTPISRIAWILGKSLIGAFLSLLGCEAMVLIMGVAGMVNFFQLVIFVFISSLISIIIGFWNGLESDDMITAVGATKLIIVPLALSVAGYQFLSGKWQWLLYWSPFYWTYKGNIAILNGSMTWLNLLLYSGVVLVITTLLFVTTLPRIRKGLEQG